MTNPMQYGAYKYESAPARALGDITSDSFEYKDQQKNLVQLNNSVSYMAAYMRKMQKGIDEANENFIQQIQSLINDIVVLIGGGGDTGFDFGDLKYVFQMIGALFGLGGESGIPVPLNFFQAAWHFVSNYIIPNGNFTDVINMIIDNAIAGILDIFGDVPIVGQALQQLAVIISDIRDALSPIFIAIDSINEILENFNLDGLFGPDGFIKSTLIPQLGLDKLPSISISSLTGDQPNLLISGDFFDIHSVETNPFWFWDAAVTHSTDSTGSVKTIANSSMKGLRSNEVIVSKGQELTFGIFTKWEDYVGDNYPVRLHIIEFKGSGENAERIGTLELDRVNPPSADALDWYPLAGDYTVPEGVNSIRLRPVVTQDAHVGTIHFDDAFCRKTGLLQIPWMSGLQGIIDGIKAQWQLLVDIIHNTISGATGLFNTLEDLVTALLNIPFGNILGIGGPANIGGTIFEFFNQLVGGFFNNSGMTGAGLPDVFSTAQTIGANSFLGLGAWDLWQIRNNSPLLSGFLPSGSANANLPGGTTAPTFNVTQAISAISIIRVDKEDSIGVVSWYGYDLTNITAFYVNVWKINLANGNRDLVHHSPNIIGSLDGGGSLASPPAQFYDIDPDDSIPVKPGEVYGRELVPVGSGTHKVVGSTTWQSTAHPRSNVLNLAEKRDNTTNPNSPPSTILKANVVASQNVPFIEWAIDSGYGETYQHAPTTQPLSGTGTIPRPSWANYIDYIVMAPGGGARQGGTAGFYGEGGGPGEVKTGTWIIGTDFDASDVIISYDYGDGGLGGTGNGAPGEDATLEFAGNTVTAIGGVAGTELKIGGRPIGVGPNNGVAIKYKGMECQGGINQNVYGENGVAPGGGGNGGNWISFQFGGNGAPGGGWLRFRQNALPGEMVIGDITPPSAPNITDVSVTYSTIVFKAIGAVDDSGTVSSFNFFLDGVKQNQLVQSSNEYMITGLSSNTDYSLTATALDANGNESVQSTPYVATTLEYLPSGTPMSLTDTNAIDAIVAANLTASGAVLAIDGPRGFYTKAYGKKTEFPGAADMTLDDHFRVGSISKTFTARVILMLIDQGLLHFEDVVETFIPGIPNGSDMTIRMVLSMRSGIFEFLADPMVGIIFSLFPWWGFSEEAALNIMKGKEGPALPGTAWAYANSNFVLLGAIARVITGKPIKQLIKEMCIDPIGLTETSWPNDYQMPQPAPTGYKPGLIPGTFQDGTWLNPELFGAAGCIVSTAHDIKRWCEVLRDGELLSPTMHNKLETDLWAVPWTNDDQLTNFGYGYGYFSLGQWLGHAGTCPGFEGTCYYLPDGTVMAMLENKQTPIVEVEVKMMFLIGLYLDVGSMHEPTTYKVWPDGA